MKSKMFVMIAIIIISMVPTVWAAELEIKQKQWTMKDTNGCGKWLPGRMFVTTVASGKEINRGSSTVDTRVNVNKDVEKGELLGVVYFGKAKSDLEAVESEKLLTLIGKLKDKQIIVEGHACWIGDSTYNENLSFLRGNTIASILRDNGVSVVAVRGFGEEVIIDRENPAANRRVEIYQTKGKEH